MVVTVGHGRNPETVTWWPVERKGGEERMGESIGKKEETCLLKNNVKVKVQTLFSFLLKFSQNLLSTRSSGDHNQYPATVHECSH